MTEPETTKPAEVEVEGLRRPILILQIFTLFFFFLSLTLTLALMLVALRSKVVENFHEPDLRPLWLLLALSIFFAIVLHLLSSPQLRRRKYSTAFGLTSLTLGLLNAVEILYLLQDPEAVPNYLWFLFVVLTILGAIGVYLPDRATRLEEQEEKQKAREALLKKRSGPKVLRLKPRRYYVYESKILFYKDLIRGRGK